MAAKKWTLEHTESNAAILRLNLKYGETFRVLLRGDAHHDNPHSDWDLERKHLDNIKECGGAVLDVGDLYCAMQGKFDKRSSKDSVREEHQGGDYLDALVRTAADFYGPYAEHLAVLGLGNHEQSIYQRHETHLTARLVERLNDRHKTNVQCGGYTGWLRIQAKSPINRTVSRNIWYCHGYGGGGPVTGDMIQAAARQPVYVGNADIMVSGHVHEAWYREIQRMDLNTAGRISRRPIHIVKVATYKEEYGTGGGGWHVETGKPPKPLGAWYADFTLRSNKIDQNEHLEIAISRAN